MTAKKTPTKKAAQSRKKPSDLSEAEPEPKPRPAFHAFELEDERHGKNILRGMNFVIFGGKNALNVSSELWMLYRDALGQPAPWRSYHTANGKTTQNRHKAIPPVEAAEELVKLALDGVALVGLLCARERDLCRKVARRLGQWPVNTDLTAKDWKRDAQQMIDNLGVGSGIAGYVKAARTADENPIRQFAAAIYETLYQTRWQYKEPDSESRTHEGCPPWAGKTLELPRFIKANVGAWMRVGKEMLLEQMPDFLQCQTLSEQNYKWSRRAGTRSKSGNPTLRAIQNEAFSDIGKEMKNLAPEEAIFGGKW